jgi:hypothetical protein
MTRTFAECFNVMLLHARASHWDQWMWPALNGVVTDRNSRFRAGHSNLSNGVQDSINRNGEIPQADTID